MEIEGTIEGASWRWSLLISVIFLNIVLPNLVLSYGILLVEEVELGSQTWFGLLTPTLFILSYGFSQCWFREATDSWGESLGYRIIAAVGLILIVIGLILCAFLPYILQPYVYGVLGGLGSSLISAQVDSVVFDSYDTNLGLVRGLCFSGQAIGQSLFPHIISALIKCYGYPYFYLFLAGIMLQTLPAIMFLKVDLRKRRITYSRYSDFAKTYAFNNDNFFTELPLKEMGNKSWRNPMEDTYSAEEDFFFDHDSAGVMETITPPPSPEEKRRNMFGVEILPEIPEESEYGSDNEDSKRTSRKTRFSTTISRLSTLGDNFDECISNQSRRDSLNDQELSESHKNSDVEVTYDNIAVRDVEREKIFNSFSFRCRSAYAGLKRRMLMPSYRMYRLRRRMVYFTYNINDIFIKPLTRSLSCWRFYPALLLCFCRLSLASISLVLFPIIGAHVHQKISTSETNFLLSLHGFTWICFMLSTPWLAETPKRNFKYIAILGLFISSAACFSMALADSHDGFSVGCVVAGLGFGAITSSVEPAVQDFVGIRQWPKLRSPLETLAALTLALFYAGIAFVIDEENGLHLTMFILGVTLSVITIIWFILAFVEIYYGKIKGRLCRRKPLV